MEKLKYIFQYILHFLGISNEFCNRAVDDLKVSLLQFTYGKFLSKMIISCMSTGAVFPTPECMPGAFTDTILSPILTEGVCV